LVIGKNNHRLNRFKVTGKTFVKKVLRQTPVRRNLGLIKP
jgi:hypothetical protein